MSQPPTAPGGVFLSYAREDTEPARRIADALRAFGVEVWFDQNELRGGDSWDAKIKKQIRDCSLFVALISANTQSRGEGYFRREWKMAVERTHDMAAGMPFLLPVVVDATRESDALVPEELLRVQWTRLPRGVPTAEFVEGIQRLLSPPKGGAQPPRDSRPLARVPPAAAPAASLAPPKRASQNWGVLAALSIIPIVALVLFLDRKPASPAPAPSPLLVAAPAASANDKSLAVLPFTNMSDDKDNAFFTDGIHEDILTNLAQIHDLRVVSRTSVMQFKGTTKPIREIAAELGVAYILEGSVRRSGGKVRVTGQLIRAATDEHVWAKAYDRDLTDIFTIQGQLAEAIADALKTELSPHEKEQIARRPTENPVAYDLYLQARDVRNREGSAPAVVKKQIALLKQAVQEDPNFAAGWSELADAHAYLNFQGFDDDGSNLALAKTAIERAQQLAPDDPLVIGNVGTYYYYGFRDYARANEKYQILARERPNDPALFNALSLILRRQGKWAESLVSSRRAVELDPANAGYLRNHYATLTAGNHWDEAAPIAQRLTTLLPGNLETSYLLALLPFSARGSTAEADAYFAHLSPEVASSPAALDARRDWAINRGDWSEALRLDRLQHHFSGSTFTVFDMDAIMALVEKQAGNSAAAVARLGDLPDRLRAQLKAQPHSSHLLIALADAELVLGHNEEAIRCADQAVEATPESRDALDGATYAGLRAQIYDQAGKAEVALKEYARLLRTPQGLNVHYLAHAISTLHGDPRFEALLKDPANNAPLF